MNSQTILRSAVLVTFMVASEGARADEPVVTTATSPPDADEARREAKPPTPKPSSAASIRIDGGWSPRTLLALPVRGADMGFAAGAQPAAHGALWGSGRLFLGSTENGLSLFTVSLAAEAELVFDRFRVGGGLGGFLIGVNRVARDETLFSWGPALHGAARFDVIRSESFAMFARAILWGGYDVYANSVFWGPTLGAGVDFDVVGKRAQSEKVSK